MAVRRALFVVLFGLSVSCAHARGPKLQVWADIPPAADSYQQAGPGPATFANGQPSAALGAAVESSARANGSNLVPDARLGQVARFLAERKNMASDPPARLVELAARHVGVFDPVLQAFVLPLPNDAGASLVPLLAAKLGSAPFTHYGAALTRNEARGWLIVVLSERLLALEPVPRSVPLGQPIRLQGQLPAGFTQPRVDLMPAGAARAILPLGAESAFDLQLPTSAPGLHRIEIIGEGESGSRVLARLPVYVGMPVPAKIELLQTELAYDLAAIRAQIRSSIQRERAKAGLPALGVDARLDSIALEHCIDMRDHDFVDHVSPRTGDPQQRLQRAGLQPVLVLETLLRGGDGASLEVSAASSAGELRNMLVRELTHVGIGVVAVPDVHGPLLLATEVFVQLPSFANGVTAEPRLLAAINEARTGRGSGVVSLDVGLSEVARRAAKRFIADAEISEQGVVDAANAELGKFSLAYQRVNALLAVTARLEDVTTLEPVLDPRAGGLGIGIAEGVKSGRGPVMAVVLIVGTRR